MSKDFTERLFNLSILTLHIVILSRVRGFYWISDYKFQADKEPIIDFFKKGFDLITDGVDPSLMEVKLDMEEISYVQNSMYNMEDLQLIKFSKKLLNCIQTGNLELLLLFINYFLKDYKNQLWKLFSKYDLYSLDGEKVSEFEAILYEVITQSLDNTDHIIDYRVYNK